MYKELTERLDQIGLTYDKDELKLKVDQAEKHAVAQALITKAKEISFALESNQAKSVVAALSETFAPDCQAAVNALLHYSQLNANDQLEYREQLYTQFIRHTSVFDTVMQLNGEYARRWF
ncbi:hypothetical protein MHN79_06860 [Vibrio sp. Of14-4]|uniref:hypothetical protein n=1 Tax=Vibrio sp. Of14-4 TaxID=2724878 RepID=UPI001EF22F3F|nr:hypothetical protein [Vibrio sp. Of14-4]MCG7489205.1 hypothetical protein [Vibrio sp. Of14-4]